MARTGRPPRSIEERKRDGTLRADRHPETPMIVGGRTAPTPPASLTPEQRECFLVITDALCQAGILDTADAGMVELAAIEKATVDECNRIIADRGLVIDGKMGSVINPANTARGKALLHLRQLYAELGIGPASRARFQSLGIKPTEPHKHLAGIGGKPVSLDEARAIRASK